MDLPEAHLAEAMLGVRVWVGRARQGQEPRLISLIMREIWQPRVTNRATCPTQASHTDPPAPYCYCGYYVVDPRVCRVRIGASVSGLHVRVALTDPAISKDHSWTDCPLGDGEALVVGLGWLWGTGVCGSTGVWRGRYGHPAALVAFTDETRREAARAIGMSGGRDMVLAPGDDVFVLGETYGVPVLRPPVSTEQDTGEASLPLSCVILDGTQVARIVGLVRALETARVEQCLVERP